MNPTLTDAVAVDVQLLRRAVRLARPDQTTSAPRWAAIRDTFGVGSTRAKELAVRFGLATALSEYGLAWRYLPRPTDDGDRWLFIYAIAGSAETRFDRCTFKERVPVAQEWNWVDWEAVAKTFDTSPEELQASPLPVVVSILFKYYGAENVFGSSYWEGFRIGGVSPRQ